MILWIDPILTLSEVKMVLFCRMYKNVSKSLLSPRDDSGKGNIFLREGRLLHVVCTDQGKFWINSIATQE